MAAETATSRIVYCLNPTAVPKGKDRPVSARPADLKSKTIGVLWNTKPNANVLMLEMAAQSAAVLAKLAGNDEFLGFGGVEQCKFRDTVVPPARLENLMEGKRK